MKKEKATESASAETGALPTRLAYLEFGEEDRRALGELRVALSDRVAPLVNEWHGFLLSQPETGSLLSRGRVREHLEAIQVRYFHTLLEGRHDATYFRERLRVGAVHERVGLEPWLYLGAYRKFQALVRAHLLLRGFAAERLNRWLEALEKVVCLDTQLALEAYFQARSREVSEANEALSQTSRALEVRNLELNRQFERAQESARIKEEFLSKISHELRTPLNGILGFADLLADGIEGPVTSEQVRSLGKIRTHGERLLAMIEQMLDAAKMAAAGIAEPAPFDPLPIVGHVAEDARQAAEAKGLAFSAELPSRLPSALGDAQGFSVSLSHLAENAVKFTRSGAVRLEAAAAGTRLRFAVHDTGPGVPAEHRARIFNAFHQVEVGDTRSASGLGMGLTLARQALERMGGELTLEASGPAGSTFLIELPRYLPEGEEGTCDPDGHPADGHPA